MARDASKRLISATQMSPVTESQLASGSDGDRIVDHQPSAANTTFAAVRFEHKEYNVTNYFEKFWIIPGIIPLRSVWKSTSASHRWREGRTRREILISTQVVLHARAEAVPRA